MNLTEWLNYIGSIHRIEIDLGLERIKKVAAILGIKTFACPIVTVAGTNGKGSCVATIDAIVRQAGYTVAAYTSPHLLNFNERIQIAGKPVTDEELCNAFGQIEIARVDISLTFFEFVTLAALLIFQQYELDLIVLEVGLGGRLDAVNIIEPDIAVISTIALDHTDRLGDNREQIGFEKAGIFRKGKRAVCGDYAIPDSVQKYADRLSIKLAKIGHDFSYQVFKKTWDWANQRLTYRALPMPDLELQNVATGMQVISLLNDQLPVSEQAIRSALAQLALPGRFYRLLDKVEVIFDVAHNPAGGEWLARKLVNQVIKGRILAVVGMLADKDQKATLAPLIDIVSEWFVADLGVPRGGTAKQLIKHLTELGGSNLYSYQTAISAYQTANLQAAPDDMIIVFGSFHTVGEVLGFVRGSN